MITLAWWHHWPSVAATSFTPAMRHRMIQTVRQQFAGDTDIDGACYALTREVYKWVRDSLQFQSGKTTISTARNNQLYPGFGYLEPPMLANQPLYCLSLETNASDIIKTHGWHA